MIYKTSDGSLRLTTDRWNQNVIDYRALRRRKAANIACVGFLVSFLAIVWLLILTGAL